MAWDPTNASNTRLGKYRILRQLGAGGMGAVYHATDTESGTDVALKVLSDAAASDPRRLERFHREAVHMAKLRHENIVSLLQFGESAGTYFLALEYVDGSDLEGYIRQNGPLTPSAAWQILVQLAMALDHAYERGIVHRDIKPGNILLTRRHSRPVAKLADLGLARTATAAEGRITTDGCTVGTLDYMAPEQARDSTRADTRSDIYSLGCTLFHLLAGVPPFAQGSVLERVVKHAKTAPPDVRRYNPAVPEPLWDVCRRMLAKRPADRYQTPAELLIALTALSNLLAESEARPVAPPRQGGRATPESLAGASSSARQTTRPTTVDLRPSTGSGEHRRVAQEQYQRATQALANGNLDYGLSLLMTCCKLDPADLTYRQKLRQAQLEQHESKARHSWRLAPRRWWYQLRLLLACRRKQPLQVLALGEEMLCCDPKHLPTQLAMAEAATAASLPELTIWLLEHARGSYPIHVPLLRSLIPLYEQQNDVARAKAACETILRLLPEDNDARRHLQRLLVNETSIALRGGTPDARPARPSEKPARRLIT
jgi:serine/threonine protein kinase